MFELCAKTHENLEDEIDQMDESLSENRLKASSEGIIDVNNYDEKKIELFNKLRSIKNQSNLDSLDSIATEFNEITEELWYSLMDKEVSLHERTEDVLQVFFATIKRVAAEFLSSIAPKFDEIQMTCNRYFQSTIKQISTGESSVDEVLSRQTESDFKEHLKNVRDIQRDLDELVNKWTIETTNRYESEEYERNRTKMEQMNSYLDHQRTTFDELKSEILFIFDENRKQ